MCPSLLKNSGQWCKWRVELSVFVHLLATLCLHASARSFMSSSARLLSLGFSVTALPWWLPDSRHSAPQSTERWALSSPSYNQQAHLCLPPLLVCPIFLLSLLPSFFETGSQHVSQATLELVILLSQAPKC